MEAVTDISAAQPTLPAEPVVPEGVEDSETV